MNIVFRTDASRQVGTGHDLRCLTLADTLQAAGAQCYFICREHSSNLITQIQQQGFSVCVLPAATEMAITNGRGVEAQSNYAAWLGVDWNTDAVQTKACIGGAAVDWLVVDHYALDVRWEKILRPMCCNLMVIDDLANRVHDCDLLLDQNLGRNEHDYRQLVPNTCTVLVGSSYALLRPEFSALRDESLRRRTIPQLKRLLISMGGVDQGNATGQVLDVLKTCALPVDLHITVVMGPHAPWLAQVQALAAGMPWSTQVLAGVSNMAQLMTDSDLAIGAAGSTSWERCCLGVPSIQLVLADNQKEAAAILEQLNAVIAISSVEELPSIFQATILQRDYNALLSLMKRSAEICDGHGTAVVACKLLEKLLVS